VPIDDAGNCAIPRVVSSPKLPTTQHSVVSKGEDRMFNGGRPQDTFPPANLYNSVIISILPSVCNDSASQYGIVNIESASTLLPFMQKAALVTRTFTSRMIAGSLTGNGADLRYVSLSRSDVCAASNCRQR